MAFFKFRKASGDHQPAAQSAQSVDQIRQRAKYRLVGASILVVLGVLVFPLLFDKEPRPLPVDTPIVFSQPGVVNAPTVLQPAPASAAPAATGSVAPKAPAPAEVMITETQQAQTKPLTQPPVAAVVEPANMAKAEAKTETPAKPAKPASTETKTVAKEPAKGVEDARRAQALLNGQMPGPSSAAAAPAGRYVVQVGAFAEAARAQSVRMQIERAGIKTYTQVAQTKEGPRIRVRVGPFGDKAEAEKAAAAIKKLDLPTAILTL